MGSSGKNWPAGIRPWDFSNSSRFRSPTEKGRLIQGAVLYTGIPFHPGAVEFFESHPEIGFRPNPANRVPKPSQPTAD